MEAAQPPALPLPDHKPDADATQLLNRLSEGDAEAENELFELIYGQLHALAQAHMQRESEAHTLQPTALVHEAYVRLVRADDLSFQSRGHFYSLASRVMRSCLVDHARRKKSEKRGGDRVRVALDGMLSPTGEARELELIAVNEAVEQLTELKPELGRIVELRFFGGLSIPQVAETLDIPQRTIERRWKLASAWLFDVLDDPEEER